MLICCQNKVSGHKKRIKNLEANLIECFPFFYQCLIADGFYCLGLD